MMSENAQKCLTPIGILGAKEEALDVYVRTRTDAQLLHYNEPEPGLFVAESIVVIERAMDAGYEAVSFLIEKKQLPNMQAVLARAGDVPVYTGTEEELKKLLGFVMPRGILCAMRRRALPSAEEVCRGASRIAVLEDVENPTNVGAIFRSAAALGIDGILLTETCSDPLYRRATRVSMGAVFQIPWTVIAQGDGRVAQGDGRFVQAEPEQIYRPPVQLYRPPVQNLGFTTVAMALREDALPIDAPELKNAERLAIFLGAEAFGLKEETIAACDHTAMIPMSHGVDSLNVAAASAVIFWELRRTS